MRQKLVNESIYILLILRNCPLKFISVVMILPFRELMSRSLVRWREGIIINNRSWRGRSSPWTKTWPTVMQQEQEQQQQLAYRNPLKTLQFLVFVAELAAKVGPSSSTMWWNPYTFPIIKDGDILSNISHTSAVIYHFACINAKLAPIIILLQLLRASGLVPTQTASNAPLL